MVELNRPKALHAIDFGMVEAITAALKVRQDISIVCMLAAGVRLGAAIPIAKWSYLGRTMRKPRSGPFVRAETLSVALA